MYLTSTSCSLSLTLPPNIPVAFLVRVVMCTTQHAVFNVKVKGLILHSGQFEFPQILSMGHEVSICMTGQCDGGRVCLGGFLTDGDAAIVYTLPERTHILYMGACSEASAQ